MIRYVIYATATGVIRAILTGDPATAQANLRDGEAVLEYAGFVSATRHRIAGGSVILK